MLRFKNRVNELLRTTELERLYWSRGNKNVYVKVSYELDENAGIDWLNGDDHQNFVLLINPEFINLDSKTQKITLKHEGYHVKYFDPEIETEYRKLISTIVNAKAQVSPQILQNLINVVSILDHVDLFRKAIRDGKKDDIFEYANFKVDYLSKLNIQSFSGTNAMEIYGNIFNFSTMYALYAVSFMLEGEHEIGEHIEQKLREIFSAAGYKNYDMDAGVELVRQLINETENGRAFPSIKSIVKTFDYKNVIAIQSSI